MRAEYLDIKPDTEVISGIGLRGSLECFVELSKADEPQWLHLVLFRNRDAAGLMPAAHVVGEMEGTEEIRYETVCAGYEPALVVVTRVGSGNFLGLRILAWHPRKQDFIDLLSVDDLPPEPGSVGALIEQKWKQQEPPGTAGDIQLADPGGVFADGYFAFADLDGDGCKELIVTRGWRAIDRRTRYFFLRGEAFQEVVPQSALYQQFETVAEAVKDQTIWDNSTKRAFYPY